MTVTPAPAATAADELSRMLVALHTGTSPTLDAHAYRHLAGA